MILFILGNTIPELSDISRYIVPKYAARWKDLGVELKLPTYHLDAIAVNYVNHPWYSQECCRAMLQKWLEITPKPTWNILQKAIATLHQKAIASLPQNSNTKSKKSCY